MQFQCFEEMIYIMMCLLYIIYDNTILAFEFENKYKLNFVCSCFSLIAVSRYLPYRMCRLLVCVLLSLAVNSAHAVEGVDCTCKCFLYFSPKQLIHGNQNDKCKWKTELKNYSDKVLPEKMQGFFCHPENLSNKACSGKK